jgi:hypothetical protein
MPQAWSDCAAPCYAFFTLTIFELSRIISLQLMQRQEIFSAGGILILMVFSSTEAVVENVPGFFALLSLQITPRPAIEYPDSIGTWHLGHFVSSQLI